MEHKSLTQIHQQTKSILSELKLEKNILKEMIDKLDTYEFVEEFDELESGAVLRWIPLINPETKEEIINNHTLKSTVILCNINMTKKGNFLICKNFGFKNKHFQINMNDYLIFQKIFSGRLMIANALDIIA